MDFILEHKWVFLVAAEIVFWISVLTFLTLRYWFKLKKLSMVFFATFIINDLWIATMGFMDYLKTGEFRSYQVIILIFIIYAFTYGKSDFRKLDAFVQKKVAKLKGEEIPVMDQRRELYGRERAQSEWKQFLGHLLIYAIVHIVLIFVFGLSKQVGDINSLNQLFSIWFEEKQAQFPFDHSGFNNLSRIWTLVLAIDAAITLSYTIFPKAENKRSLDT
ncbi:hypothetical protein EI200_16445 [Peribacillus simplex]|uniref:hypothetical protein n=1 Tax=Peribacillus simplex TaxID=1478 RepID=UPI000F62C538|nr:hypothetical protein [Peribacillus simplex]RRN69518.1 hypothetical protein EI200_16445 [Peribacillus simplex]